MKSIKKVLQAIDQKLNQVQPKTMDDLISCVHTVPGVESYGTHFHIVKYMGYLQGVRVFVTGRKVSHPLPAKDKVYSVFQGVDKYEKAGYPIINEKA